MTPWSWQGSVTLDANGSGVIDLPAPNYGQYYSISTAAVRVDPRPATLEPECAITINGTFIGGSVAASFDSDSTFTEIVYHGDKLRAQWTGGDPGKQAFLSLRGHRYEG